MKYASMFGKTVKTIPSDLKAKSHQLLYQAGYIRDISAGRYSFLPLGFRVHEKIYQVIEKHMVAVNSQQIMTPTLHPIELWTATNRDKAFGAEMLVVDDHHGARFAIGATAEGLMVELVKKFNVSYRDLPVRIHQYSQKFRDEKRPRGGLLRAREFTMKDAYSFDSSEEQMMESYWAFYHAYEKIFAELELDAIPVEADSGAIGGDFNHEFIVPSDAGEGAAFTCDSCEYKAHEDRAVFVRDQVNPTDDVFTLETIDQPEWVKTMEDNEKHYQLPKSHFLKNVVYKDENGRYIIAVLRGDLDANPAKIKKLLDLDDLQDATDEDLEIIGTKPGYVHSWGHKNLIYVGDTSLETVRNFIGGQKEETTDTRNVNFRRDFETEYFGDIAMAHDGVTCGSCQKGSLQLMKGIEVGHVFKFDHFYTGPMEGSFTDNDGGNKPIWMGSYGIGLGRVMATIVEKHADEKGIVWPKVITPYQVHLIHIGESEEVFTKAQNVYEQLSKNEVSVLWDNRTDASAGTKFADADLLGIPLRIVVSERTLKEDKLEVKTRTEQEAKLLDESELFSQLLSD